MSEWKPISVVPESGTWATVYMGNCPYRGIDKYRTGFFASDNEFLSAANAFEFVAYTPKEWITHWQALTAIPKELL